MTKTSTSKRATKVTQAAVAKDVLKMLKMGILHAEHLVYCHFPGELASNKPQSFQRVLQQITPNPAANRREKCRVCAIGAIFAADVFKRNRFDVAPYRSSVTDGDMRQHLEAVFAKQDLALIEAAFEGFTMGLESPLYSLGKYARRYKDVIGDDNVRMVRIMKNIIAHGCFRPDLEVW